MKDEAMLALAKNLKTETDFNNFSKALKKLTVETALNAELTEHLGYEKNSKISDQFSTLIDSVLEYL